MPSGGASTRPSLFGTHVRRNVAAEEGNEDAERQSELALSVEIGFMRAPLEKPHDHGDHQTRGEIRIEIGGRLALAFCRFDKGNEPGVNISVDRVAEGGDGAIAARLGPDLE